MEELLEACHKFISQITPDGDGRYYDVDPQDLKEFCDSVRAAQHRVQRTAKHVHFYTDGYCECGHVLSAYSHA